MNKLRVIKDFNKLDALLQQQVLAQYPRNMKKHLITFRNHRNEMITALPFETDEFYYMLKMLNVTNPNGAIPKSEKSTEDLLQELIEEIANDDENMDSGQEIIEYDEDYN